MKKVNVKIPGKSYDILMGDDLLKRLPVLTKKLKLYENVFAVVDRNVNRIYSKELESMFNQFDKCSKYVCSADEKNKTLQTIEKIYSALQSKNYGRDTLILAVGGGIIGDIAGFVAATYTRGVQFVQVPTTLLAAVDSSVGGKTGVNFGSAKNIIGSFYQPELVLFDTGFLKTLKESELICGMGEIVKYAFLAGPAYYKYADKNIEKLYELDGTTINKLAGDSVKYKASVVALDEKENSMRKLLNLGHTFAHAFEVEQKHKIKHGEAVIVGMVCSLFLSNKIGVLSDTDLKKYLKFFNRFIPKIKLRNPDINSLYRIMQKDKKNRHGSIKFVLAKRPGEILLDVEADKKDVYFALANGIQLFIH